MKMYKKSIVACALMSVAGAGNCGISERSWLFMPMEKVTYDFTSGPIKTGMEAGCDSLSSPADFSFLITYSGTPEAEQRIYVETNDENNVSHYKYLKIFYVRNPTQIAIGLPYGGTYTIKNMSSTTVKGTECDIGTY